jgi:hypothetical protein
VTRHDPFVSVVLIAAFAVTVAFALALVMG